VAAALPSVEAGGEWDPGLQAIVRSAGAPFALGEGQSITVNLELRP
jgi:hypothetical protein